MDLQVYRNPSKVAAFYLVIYGNASCLSPPVLSYICPFYWNKYYHCPLRLGNLRQPLLFQKVVLFSVIYQSYISQKFNNRNLTVILSFSLFKHSWSASFSHLLLRSVPKQQMVYLCAAAGFIPLHPLLLSRDYVCEPVCVSLCVYGHSQLPVAIQCFQLLPAKKLGSLAYSSAMSPDVQLWYCFLPSLPAGAVFIHNLK